MKNEFGEIVCNLSFEEICRLADKVENSSLRKIKIKKGDDELVIEGKTDFPPVTTTTAVMPPVPGMPYAVSSTGELPPPPPTPAAETAASGQVSGNVVKAPIIGTFYSRPNPDKEPFVKVGSTVKKGDVLMIIESMKLMNEVQSEFDGVVKEILAKDGDALEYDQPVMIIG